MKDWFPCWQHPSASSPWQRSWAVPLAPRVTSSPLGANTSNPLWQHSTLCHCCWGMQPVKHEPSPSAAYATVPSGSVLQGECGSTGRCRFVACSRRHLHPLMEKRQYVDQSSRRGHRWRHVYRSNVLYRSHALCVVRGCTRPPAAKCQPRAPVLLSFGSFCHRVVLGYRQPGCWIASCAAAVHCP